MAERITWFTLLAILIGIAVAVFVILYSGITDPFLYFGLGIFGLLGAFTRGSGGWFAVSAGGIFLGHALSLIGVF